jgi:TolB-like protein
MKRSVSVIITLFTFVWMFGPVPASAAQPTSPVRVAILPFTMHTPSQLMYLQDGIRDMLTSRLGWEGKVQVVDRASTDQVVRGLKSDISGDEAQRLGKSLKADYVVFGSLTGAGQSISIDAKMLPISGSASPLNYTSQTRSLDDVIPQVNQFAMDINQKVFARPVEMAKSAPADEENLSTRNPELLIPNTMMPGDKISYLNPNFVEVTPEGSLRQPGLWRSQTINGGLVGMDAGDLDGDRRNEMVAVTKDKVMVYSRQGGALQSVATFNGTNADRFLSVSVMDLNQDGRDEIIVTNLRTNVSSRPLPSEIIKYEEGYSKDSLDSMVLSLSGNTLKVLGNRIPYFLNAVELPGRGKVLLGQERGRSNVGAFQAEIYEMQWRGNSLSPLAPYHLPSRCNVYNFAKADINNDHSEEIMLIDPSNRLTILSASGDQLWRSDKMFAATTNGFEGKVEDLRFNSVDVYYIPSPILVTDLNKDGIPEIVVNRSTESFGRFMPENLKYFDRGEIVSLSWDQLGLVENWKTREINGMVTAIRITDLNNDGTLELLASLVLAKDYVKFWESKSTVFGYDLNVSAAKTAAKQ